MATAAIQAARAQGAIRKGDWPCPADTTDLKITSGGRTPFSLVLLRASRGGTYPAELCTGARLPAVLCRGQKREGCHREGET